MSTEQAPAGGTPNAAVLESRYGRGPRSRRRNLIILVSGIVALSALAIVWVVWTGILGPSSAVEATDLGHDVTTREATVRWQLSAPANAEVHCAVEAQNDNHAIVGWKIIPVPASDQQVRTFSTTIRTSEPAVTGLINRCWLS
ncbi:DUF4307 domain-containing protein [Schumannella sp. 10F1B-5-1]|uniref:DUF4307 domain-containing protein n=1 Tax=Schumannella sp. 10F1B-5-1 TaxID=2590780 RepID=UPI0015E82FE6|nr:DUF4307 domain-containing protein [Schumannella sp. 10F1B-5-1]